MSCRLESKGADGIDCAGADGAEASNGADGFYRDDRLGI